jgi:opacity protein-like surface antigen
MRTSLTTLLSGAIIAASVPATAAAQFGASAPEHHLIRIGFGGGASVPTSHAGDVLKTGINGQGFVLIDLGIGLPPIRLNLGYTRFNFKDAVLGGGTGQSDILSGVGALSMPLFGVGPVHPYVTAGLGAFNVKDSFDGAATTASSSNLRFGIDGGAGVQLKLGRIDAFVEGHVQNVYTDQGVINARNIQSVPVTFGIIF